MGIQSVRSSRYGRLGLRLGAAAAAATLGVGLLGASAAEAAATHPAATASQARPAANYWELWDTDIPNEQSCLNEGEALVLNGTAYTYKCTGGGEDYSLYIIPRNG